MPNSFFTGMVVEPPFLTVASTLHDTVTSRSVAVNSSLLPSARTRTLDRIGNVVRELTTFWTV